MSISLSQTVELSCDECGTSFTVEASVIVDRSERPDLWQSCRDGRLHEVRCARGHRQYLGLPLLLHDREGRRLLFSPAPYPTTREEDQQAANALMTWFHERLPRGMEGDYLSMVRLVPREELAAVMDEPPTTDEEGSGVARIAAVAGRLEALAAQGDVLGQVAVLEQALEGVDRERDRGVWGWLQARLATALSQGVPGDPDRHLERAIAARHEALAVYTKDEFPVEWAGQEANLGNLHLRRADAATGSERDAELERAVAAYESAASVFTATAHPNEHAMAEQGLAAARSRQGQVAVEDAGSQTAGPQSFSVLKRLEASMAAGDWPQAVTLAQLMLEIVDRGSHPQEWAGHQRQLGYALMQLESGDDDVSRAIDAFQAAADALDAGTPDWIDAQLRLGESYRALSRGDPAANAGRSVAALRAAVSAMSADRDPDVYAFSCGNLGTALATAYDRGAADVDGLREAAGLYATAARLHAAGGRDADWAHAEWARGGVELSRVRAGETARAEAAAGALTSALAHFTGAGDRGSVARIQQQLGDLWLLAGEEHADEAVAAYRAALKSLDPSDVWGDVQHNLGILLAGQGELTQAIEAFEAALSVRDEGRRPVERAFTLINLAGVEAQRHSQPRAHDQIAIGLLETAARLLDPDAHPVEHAAAREALAERFGHRDRGDRAENRERAVRELRAAVTPALRACAPERWARLNVALGDALRERLRGDTDANLEAAIVAYDAALELLTPASHAHTWGLAQLNRGVAQSRRGHPDAALAAYQQALTVFTEDEFPEEWSGTQSNMALELLKRRDAESLDRAVSALEAAIGVYGGADFADELCGPRRDDPDARADALAWLTSATNLGSALDERGRAADVDRARDLYSAALRVALPSWAPTVRRALGLNLANLEIGRERWEEAYTALLASLAGARREFGLALTGASKLEAIADNEHLYRSLVDVCLRGRPQRPQEALEYAEEGRSRLQRDELATLALPPPPDVAQELVARERELLDRLRDLRAPKEPDELQLEPAVVEGIADAAEQLSQLWDTMAQSYGATDYVALRRGERVAWADLKEWLAGTASTTALLELFCLDDRLVAFIGMAEAREPIALELPLRLEQLTDWAERFVSEVVSFDPEFPLRETWLEISERLLSPLLEHLEGVEILHVVPHGPLHRLPLHALEVDGQTLLDRMAVVYAPSAAIARRLGGSADGAVGAGALVVGNPSGDLPFAEEEAQSVALRLGTTPLLGAAATKARVREELTLVGEAHLAAHAVFAASDPFDSGVELANREVLTVRDLLGLRLRARRIVVSACESGRQEVRTGDDLVGLARALFHAGVPTLVLSLWPVDDPVTRDLMVRFQEALHTPNTSVAEALRQAMRDTRREAPETYYWAPFAVFGAVGG